MKIQKRGHISKEGQKALAAMLALRLVQLREDLGLGSPLSRKTVRKAASIVADTVNNTDAFVIIGVPPAVVRTFRNEALGLIVVKRQEATRGVMLEELLRDHCCEVADSIRKPPEERYLKQESDMRLQRGSKR